jgi:2-dehydropantoate 2-reductase
VLVFGAGVLGSLYAAKLRAAGHEVVVLARGARAAEVRARGLVLEEARTGARTEARVPVVEALGPREAYDLVLVAVRKDQLAGALPALGAHRATPTVLFLVNTAEGPDALARAVGRERVLLGFPGAGGTRVGPVVRYHILAAWQQATTLGEPDGRLTPRLARVAGALLGAGFPVALSRRMDAWLKTHVAWSCPAVHALYMAGGGAAALARTRDGVVLWVRAAREAYAALGASGVPITPPPARLFALLPEPLAVALLHRLLATPTAELVLASHAGAARAEYVQLGEEWRALTRRAGVATPAFDALRPYVDPAVPPVPVGQATLPLRWRELLPAAGAALLGALTLGAAAARAGGAGAPSGRGGRDASGADRGQRSRGRRPAGAGGPPSEVQRQLTPARIDATARPTTPTERTNPGRRADVGRVEG